MLWHPLKLSRVRRNKLINIVFFINRLYFFCKIDGRAKSRISPFFWIPAFARMTIKQLISNRKKSVISAKAGIRSLERLFTRLSRLTLLTSSNLAFIVNAMDIRNSVDCPTNLTNNPETVEPMPQGLKSWKRGLTINKLIHANVWIVSFYLHESVDLNRKI